MESSETSTTLVISMPSIDLNSHAAVTYHNGLGVVPVIGMLLTLSQLCAITLRIRVWPGVYWE